jgi:hypothetical protein
MIDRAKLNFAVEEVIDGPDEEDLDEAEKPVNLVGERATGGDRLSSFDSSAGRTGKYSSTSRARRIFNIPRLA